MVDSDIQLYATDPLSQLFFQDGIQWNKSVTIDNMIFVVHVSSYPPTFREAETG